MVPIVLRLLPLQRLRTVESPTLLVYRRFGLEVPKGAKIARPVAVFAGSR